MFRYETHLHTYPVSRCASSDVIDAIKMYKDLGYDGVFITNHFIDGNINIEAGESKCWHGISSYLAVSLAF